MIRSLPRARWFPAGAAAVLALLVFAPTIRFGFAFDDDVVIVKNLFLRSLAELPRLLASTEWAGAGIEMPLYRPLTGLTYALNHAASGLSPWSYHLLNVLLHALAAGALALVARRLGLGQVASALAGAAFALHPVHVEAVANVVGRKDVLATSFVLLMLLAHRRAAISGGKWVALPVLAYAGAMLSKEVGVVGIALVAAADLASGGIANEPGEDRAGARRRRVLLYAAYASALAAYLVLLRAVTSGVPLVKVPLEDNPAAHAPAAVRVLTAIAVIGKGLWLQLLPISQSPDYSFDAFRLVRSPADPRFLAAAAALGGWLVVGLSLRRRQPVVLLGLAWYAVAVLPASNLLFPVGTLFGERLLYLPSAGLALVAGAALEAVVTRAPRWSAVAACAVLAGALGAATLSYSALWADERALFRHAAAVVPGSTRVHHKLAQLLLADGRDVEALASVDRALAIHPRDGEAHVTRAEILRALGRTVEEEAALRRALEEEPGNPDAAYGLGRLARDAGRVEEAAALWRAALEVRPDHAPSLSDLATYHLLRGEADAAVGLLERAVASDDRMAAAWFNLGLVYQARGDHTRARQALGRFVATAGPDYAAEVASVRAMLEDRSGAQRGLE